MITADDDGVIRFEVVPPFVRSPYNYDVDAVSNETGLLCMDESLTVQSDKNSTDINRIVDTFIRTGEIAPNLNPPQYGDFTGIQDYQSALNAVRAAEDSFMQLDAEVRARFGNNPQRLLEFLDNPANLDEARELGLALPAAAAPEPMAVRVVPDPLDAGASKAP